MKKFRDFEITWTGLNEGVHEFTYHLDDEKLADLSFEQEDFSKVSVDIHLTFTKHLNFFELLFDYDGELESVCDRCGDPLILQLWDEFPLVIKLADSAEQADRLNDEEEDSDIFYLARSQSSFNVFEWLYDFLVLSVPIQKIHEEDEDGNSLCNPEAIKLLKQMEDEVKQSGNNIWKGLDQFKK